MSVLRTTALIDAPVRVTGAAVRDTALAETAFAPLGLRGRRDGAADLLVPGDELIYATRFAAGRAVLRARVTRVDAGGFAAVLVSGPLPRLEYRVTLARAGVRTLLTAEAEWIAPGGPLGRLVNVLLLRALGLRVLARRLAAIRAVVERNRNAPVVVGLAVVRDGRVLAAQRGHPAAHAGRWELPGGRVEPGESEKRACARECVEELGTEVEITGRLGTDLPLSGANGDRKVLRIHVARLVDAAPTPRALEHRELRWVGPAELAELDWLPADRAFLPELRGYLREGRHQDDPPG